MKKLIAITSILLCLSGIAPAANIEYGEETLGVGGGIRLGDVPTESDAGIIRYHDGAFQGRTAAGWIDLQPDNLGTHTATKNLDLDGHDLLHAGSLYFQDGTVFSSTRTFDTTTRFSTVNSSITVLQIDVAALQAHPGGVTKVIGSDHIGVSPATGIGDVTLTLTGELGKTDHLQLTSTGTLTHDQLEARLTVVAAATTTVKTEFDSYVSASTTTFASVAAATTTLRTDVDEKATSAHTHDQFTSIATDTTTIQGDLNSYTIANDAALADVAAATSTLQLDLTAKADANHQHMEYQTADDDLTDLADGELTPSKIDAGVLPADVVASSVALQAVGRDQLQTTGTPDGMKYLRDDMTWGIPAGTGQGDMMAATYDNNSNDVVDNADKLGDQAPAYYANREAVYTATSTLRADLGAEISNLTNVNAAIAVSTSALRDMFTNGSYQTISVGTATVSLSCSGNAATVTNGLYTNSIADVQTIKVGTATVALNCSGNASTVTNGIYSTTIGIYENLHVGTATIAKSLMNTVQNYQSIKVGSATIADSCTGNAGTVTNGIYSTTVGAYESLRVGTATIANSLPSTLSQNLQFVKVGTATIALSCSGNATTVTNGIYSTTVGAYENLRVGTATICINVPSHNQSPSTITNGTFANGVKVTTGSLSLSGIASATTFIRGDGTWSTPSGTGDMSKTTYDANTNNIVDNTESFNGHADSYFAQATHTHDLTNLNAGTLATNIKVSTGSLPGTPAPTQYLRGDGSWQTINAGGGDMSMSTYDTNTNDTVDNADKFNGYTYEFFVSTNAGTYEQIKVGTATVAFSCSGNAATVTNGIYSTTVGAYENLRVGTATIANSLTSSVQNYQNVKVGTATISLACSGNAATVTNGVYTNSTADVQTIKVGTATVSLSCSGNAATVTNGLYTNSTADVQTVKVGTATVSLACSGNATTATTANAVAAPNVTAGTFDEAVKVSTGSIIASGTASSTTYLRGDGAWIEVAAAAQAFSVDAFGNLIPSDGENIVDELWEVLENNILPKQ